MKKYKLKLSKNTWIEVLNALYQRMKLGTSITDKFRIIEVYSAISEKYKGNKYAISLDLAEITIVLDAMMCYADFLTEYCMIEVEEKKTKIEEYRNEIKKQIDFETLRIAAELDVLQMIFESSNVSLLEQ